MILDHEGGVPTALALVDYKTSVRGTALDHALQLQVYAKRRAARGPRRSRGVHDLKKATRDPVGVAASDIEAAEQIVTVAAARIRVRDYAPNPGPGCRSCEVRTVCKHAAT